MKIIVTNNGITWGHIRLRTVDENEDVDNLLEDGEFLVKAISFPSEMELEEIFETIFAFGIEIGRGNVEVPFEMDPQSDLFDEVD